MLVEVEKIAKFPWSPILAQVSTPFGRTAVRWCGDPNAAAGQHHVEWEIDEEIVWGKNAKPTSEAAAELRQGGHCVIVRGRLDVTVDGAAVLDLAGTVILLDLAVPVPAEVAGTWVELFIQRENIALYPYNL
ncbi:hypothetical protein [Dactylosporangium sp. NPDC000521]|uniref:hypothetical protein n=1 Tax=Dactylosporangium sp. NPDC000521 TaxID=3363975 RepID=UPI00369FB98F